MLPTRADIESAPTTQGVRTGGNVAFLRKGSFGLCAPKVYTQGRSVNARGRRANKSEAPHEAGQSFHSILLVFFSLSL